MGSSNPFKQIINVTVEVEDRRSVNPLPSIANKVKPYEALILRYLSTHCAMADSALGFPCHSNLNGLERINPLPRWQHKWLVGHGKKISHGSAPLHNCRGLAVPHSVHKHCCQWYPYDDPHYTAPRDLDWRAAEENGGICISGQGWSRHHRMGTSSRGLNTANFESQLSTKRATD
jgi:hypothetical protein